MDVQIEIHHTLYILLIKVSFENYCTETAIYCLKKRLAAKAKNVGRAMRDVSPPLVYYKTPQDFAANTNYLSLTLISLPHFSSFNSETLIAMFGPNPNSKTITRAHWFIPSLKVRSPDDLISFKSTKCHTVIMFFCVWYRWRRRNVLLTCYSYIWNSVFFKSAYCAMVVN